MHNVHVHVYINDNVNFKVCSLLIKWLQVRGSLRDGDICAAYRHAHQSRLLSRFAISLGVLLTVAIVLPSVLVPLICNNSD